jgi:hypothetical protein
LHNPDAREYPDREVTMKIVLDIEIAKPQAEVFQYFADVEFVNSVDPAILSCRLVSGTPFTKGVVWEMVFRGLVNKLYGKYTLLDYAPPNYFTVDMYIPQGPAYEITSFETLPNGNVKVTWDSDYNLKWYMLPIYPLMRRMVITKGGEWMKLMKQAIETGVVPPKP